MKTYTNYQVGFQFQYCQKCQVFAPAHASKFHVIYCPKICVSTMDPCGTRCSAWRDNSDIWDKLKDQYKDRTATLQAKEEELKMRISQMESLLAGRMSESCCCTQTSNVPKVFPKKLDNPVRDVSRFSDDSPPPCVAPSSLEGVSSRGHKSSLCQKSGSRKVTPVSSPSQSPSRSQSPKKQPNSPTFFQKVMENAKSILTLKCSAIHPALDERPTRENDVVVYSSSLKPKKSSW